MTLHCIHHEAPTSTEQVILQPSIIDDVSCPLQKTDDDNKKLTWIDAL